MSSLLVDSDAFASGQIGSKIWLCEELEKISYSHPPTVWILGGWYGVLAFLLLSRGKLPVKAIRSFDLDEEATTRADIFNNLWVWEDWKFKAFTQDVNGLDFKKEGRWGPLPDIVINTSCEHFPDWNWAKKIPAGTLLVAQSCDMKHDDHIAGEQSIDMLKNEITWSRIFFEGEKKFQYPSWSFRRFMVIGEKD